MQQGLWIKGRGGGGGGVTALAGLHRDNEPRQDRIETRCVLEIERCVNTAGEQVAGAVASNHIAENVLLARFQSCTCAFSSLSGLKQEVFSPPAANQGQ